MITSVLIISSVTWKSKERKKERKGEKKDRKVGVLLPGGPGWGSPPYASHKFKMQKEDRVVVRL